MPDYVLYARKSTESEDRQVASIPAQVQELRALAARRGIAALRVIEESRSAKEPGRPLFNELLRDIHAGKVAGILCWKLDRLARNPIDGGAVAWALSKHKVEEIATPGRTFTASSDDALLMSIEFGMAKKYVDDLSENVKRGQRARIARGWTSSCPPAGYLSDRNTKTIVRDPIRFPLLRRAFELVLADTRPSEVYRVLTDVWGYRRPAREGEEGKPIALSRFYEILGSPFYAGLLPYCGEIYKGSHEPMVSPDELAEVQRILHREGRSRPQRHEWAYTGLLRCGKCGGIATASWQRSRSGNRYPYYHCPRRHGCKQPYVRLDRLEGQLAEMLGRVELDQEIVTWYQENLASLAVHRKREREAVTVQRTQTRKSVESQLTNLADLRIRNVIRDEDYLAKRTALLGQLTSLEAPVTSMGVFEPARGTILTLNQVKSRFADLSTSQKRRLTSTVCSNLRVLDGNLLADTQEPFSIIGEGSGIPVWWAQADDVRKARLAKLIAYFDLNKPEIAVQASRVLDCARDATTEEPPRVAGFERHPYAKAA